LNKNNYKVVTQPNTNTLITSKDNHGGPDKYGLTSIYQMLSETSLVYKWTHTTVPVGVVYPSLQCWHLVASVVC